MSNRHVDFRAGQFFPETDSKTQERRSDIALRKDSPVRMLVCVLAQEPGGGEAGARGEALPRAGLAALPRRAPSSQAQMQIRLQPSSDRHLQDAEAPQDWAPQ